MNSSDSIKDIGETSTGLRRVETLLLTISVLYLLRIYWRIKWKSTREIVPVNRNKGKFYVTPVSHIPIKIPYLNGAITLYEMRKHGVKILEKWGKEWGKGGVFSMEAGPEYIHAIADATIAHKVLSSTDSGHLNKPDKLYDKLFVAWLKEGLVNSKFEKWSAHRKILNRGFTYRSLQTYLKFIMNEHSKNLAKDLLAMSSEHSSGVQGDRMYDLIYFHTIKIISQILMGNQCCTDEEATEFHKVLRSHKDCVIYRFMHPELFIEPIWMLHPRKRLFDRNVNWCNKFSLKIINKYKEKRDRESEQGLEFEAVDEEEDLETSPEVGTEFKQAVEDDGIKPLRCMIEEMIHSEMTDTEMLDEIMTVMSAGHETTSVALQMLMFNLALNPVHQARCHEEVDNLFNSKLTSCDFDYDLSVDDLSSLKYLERCILESGRITPTVPLFARRLDKPLEIDEGLKFEGGTTVVLLSWVVHRNPSYYPEPDKFNPDRFLPEVAKQRPAGTYLTFSGGARNCIGWKLASLEIKVIMAWLLRYFEIHTTDGPDDVKLYFDITLAPERNHRIILKRR